MLRFGSKLASAALGLSALFGPGAAAQAQGFSWTGFYLGANAGGSWSKSELGVALNGGSYFADTSVPSIKATGSGSDKATGFTGGGQAGYNWQSGTIVFGLEVDIQTLAGKASVGGTKVYPCCAPTNYTVGTSLEADWLATIRPRLGFTTGNMLLYVTGGLAISDMTLKANFTDTFGSNTTGTASDSGIRTGWVLGGGLEFALNRNWSLKGEYLHVDLGGLDATYRIRVGTSATPPTFLHSGDMKVDIVRAGINYKF